MFKSFFDTVQSLNTLFFGAKAWCNKSDITQGFWLVPQAILWQKVLEILPLDETIHIPSILHELITSLDKFFKTSRRLEDPGFTVGGGGFSP